jgi:hypothetical protein
MPSPFPGMDSWLEDPGHWGNIHGGLIAQTQYLLNRLVRPKYLARIEDRLYLLPDDDPVTRQRRVADVRVERSSGRGRRRRTAGRAATAVAVHPVELITASDPQERERFIDVIEHKTGAVVTTVEVLSPSNKLAGSESRKQYLLKYRQVTGSPVHFVEIDLLRHGERHHWQGELRSHDYLCHVSPADRRPAGLAWPIRLAERLPVVDIPLAAGDPAVKLDLQAVFDEGYDRGSWDGAADYRRPPEPPLTPDLDAWADALLKEKGLR